MRFQQCKIPSAGNGKAIAINLFFTTERLARHSRNQKIDLNHEPHEKHEKIKDTKILSTDDADGRR